MATSVLWFRRDLRLGDHPALAAAARKRLDDFRGDCPADYDDDRHVPGADATSRLSPYLKWGCIHPRQVLAGLERTKGEERFRTGRGANGLPLGGCRHAPAPG